MFSSISTMSMAVVLQVTLGHTSVWLLLTSLRLDVPAEAARLGSKDQLTNCRDISNNTPAKGVGDSADEGLLITINLLTRRAVLELPLALPLAATYPNSTPSRMKATFPL